MGYEYQVGKPFKLHIVPNYVTLSRNWKVHWIEVGIFASLKEALDYFNANYPAQTRYWINTPTNYIGWKKKHCPVE